MRGHRANRRLAKELSRYAGGLLAVVTLVSVIFIATDLGLSATWLAGTGLGVACILFAASRFGLTGA